MSYSNRKRAGITAVLAMVYLMIFSALALGFYSATTTSSQMSSSDQNIGKAHLAAESAMDFMRYQLASVHIPPSTPSNQVINSLYTNLQGQLEGTSNLAGQTIAMSGNTIEIPGATGSSIKLDSGNESRFHATITDWAGEIVVKVDGMNGSASVRRAFTMDFSRQQHTTSAFNYAVASRGQVVLKKGIVTSSTGIDPAIATLMSAQVAAGAINVSGGTLGGDLNIITGASATITGGTIGGSSTVSDIIANHLHEVDAPEFPTCDPTVYKPYATNVNNGAKVQKNIIVKAGTNPKFNAGDTVQGIMYIESPNQVTFNGDFKLQGFIVMESSASTTDGLVFKGNLTMSPLPNNPLFDPLRATSGIAILAPSANVAFTGSSGGTLKGNVIVNSFNFAGASDLSIDQGTIMTLSPNANSAVFNGAKNIRFSATGASNLPKIGVSYSSYYSPNPASYQEVTP